MRDQQYRPKHSGNEISCSQLARQEPGVIRLESIQEAGTSQSAHVSHTSLSKITKDGQLHADRQSANEVAERLKAAVC
jgi:hypothetical protein